MPPEKIIIYNGKIITPFRVIESGCVLITGDTITEVSEKNIEISDAIEIDAKEKYVAPGFIDIHVHGGGGYDFMDATETAFLAIAETHAGYGTTAMLPTTLTSGKELLIQTLDAFERAGTEAGGCLLGVDSLAAHGAYLADISYSRKVDITYLGRQGDIRFD